MFGRRGSARTVCTYYAVYRYEYTGSPTVEALKAPDDESALTAAQALVGTGLSHDKLIGVLRDDGHSVKDYTADELHTAQLERDLGYR